MICFIPRSVGSIRIEDTVSARTDAYILAQKSVPALSLVPQEARNEGLKFTSSNSELNQTIDPVSHLLRRSMAMLQWVGSVSKPPN